MKRKKNFADMPLETCTGTLERIGGSQFGPCLDLGIEEAAAAMFPATAVAGGEGE